jgi:peptidoglycan/LPS O-acetylase OafA/YrhL
MVAAAGLSVFFCLSGFLIVSMLLRNDNVVSFFIRRFFRILPLVWLVLLTMLFVERPAPSAWYSNLFFYANLVPRWLLPHGEQLWSLSVEMQFYVAVGLAVAALGSRALFLVPLACVTVTLARAIYGMEFSIITWFCADEILAGGTLALVLHYAPSVAARRWPASVTLLLFAALLVSCHEQLGATNYLRAYVTALLVFSTIYPREDFLHAMLSSRPLGYFAKLSYAVYVFHPLTYAGWLGEGDVLVRYSKRLVSFALTFAGAHVSTMYYEKYWNELGHKLASSIEHRRMKVSGYQSKPTA